MKTDWQRVERSLAQVEAYQASGQKAKVWAQAHGVNLRDLASWCAHAQRWRAAMAKRPGSPGHEGQASKRPLGFVAAQLPLAQGVRARAGQRAQPGGDAPSVRIELAIGHAHMVLHWPCEQAQSLVSWSQAMLAGRAP
jgi:hypothetical protein